MTTGKRYVTVANKCTMPVVWVGTTRLQMSITNHGNKVLIKNICLNDELHAPESKESLMSAACSIERRLKVKID